MADKKTPEEMQREKEEKRNIALDNLRSNEISDLAVAYFIEKSGQYGEGVSSAYENFKYIPAMQGNEKHVLNSLLSSRQDGRRYSGNVSEYKIIQDSAEIIQGSILNVKINDILELMGSSIKLGKKYEEKYISDIAKSENKEDKETLNLVIGGYIQYLSDKKISEAISLRAKRTKSGLEEMLMENPKEEKK